MIELCAQGHTTDKLLTGIFNFCLGTVDLNSPFAIQMICVSGKVTYIFFPSYVSHTVKGESVSTVLKYDL